MIGGPSTRKECGTPGSSNSNIVLEFSNNGGNELDKEFK